MEELSNDVRRVLGEDAAEHVVRYGELTLIVPADAIVETLRKLHDDPALRFVSFIDICGVDYPEREQRFDVVYHLLSPYRNQRIRVKVVAGEAGHEEVLYSNELAGSVNPAQFTDQQRPEERWPLTVDG